MPERHLPRVAGRAPQRHHDLHVVAPEAVSGASIAQAARIPTVGLAGLAGLADLMPPVGLEGPDPDVRK